jgi:hypothetical protein
MVILVIRIYYFCYKKQSRKAGFPKLVGCKKFLKCDFFNYIKTKNPKKWESEKQKKTRKG